MKKLLLFLILFSVSVSSQTNKLLRQSDLDAYYDSTYVTFGALLPDSIIYTSELDTIVNNIDTLEINASYRWYVDSENGSDANNGKTPATAFKNLTKIQTLYDANQLPEYSTIYLKSGSAWGQSLVLGNNYIIQSYDVGERPLISGADTVANADFEVHSSDIYKVTDYKALNTFMVICAYENGEGLVRVTSLTDMPAGTFAVYNQNTSDFQDASFNEVTSDTSHRYTIYIRATDSSDVSANSKVYEVTKRGYAIYLGNDCKTINIHTTKQGNRDGSLILGKNALIDSCTMSWGHKHNALIGTGIVRNSIFLYNEKPQASGGAGILVASTTYPELADVEYRNNYFYIKENDNYTAAAISHSSGNDNPYNRFICDGNYFYNGVSAVFANEYKSVYITNNTVTNAATGFSADNAVVTDSVFITGNIIIRDSTTSLLKSAGNTYIEDNLIYFKQSDDASIIKLTGTGKEIEIKNNIFYKKTVGGMSAGVIVWNTRDNNSFDIKNNIFYNWGWIKFDSLTVSDVQADSNIYYPFSQIILANNVTLDNLQEVQDSTTWDDNSLATNPEFIGSPLLGNWFYKEDNAVSLGAGDVPINYNFTANDGDVFSLEAELALVELELDTKLNIEDVDLISKTDFYSLLALAAGDTVALNYYDEATLWDEFKYVTDDTLSVMAQYKQDDSTSWTNMFATNLVMNGSGTTTTFAVDTIPAESQTRMYVITTGDNLHDGWVKIYRRLTEDVETVWTDTLYYWDFVNNINDVESQQTVSSWQNTIGNKFGICKSVSDSTNNAFIYFYTDSTTLTSSKEIRIKYSFYVPSANTGFESAPILIGTPNMNLNFYEGSTNRWVDVDTTLTLTSNINQFRLYFAENGQYKNYAIGDIWYFDNVMILTKP